MSAVPRFKDDMPFNGAATAEADRLVIIGGGLSAIFTAYEILRQSRKNGNPVPVTLIADRISAPSPTGSHIVLEVEGLFADEVPHRKQFNKLLRGALQKFERMLERENINSRFNKGYELKAETPEDLHELIAKLIDKKIYKSHEISVNTNEQTFHLPKHPHSARIDSIGQINMPELLQALLDRIKDMGGDIQLQTRYKSHKKEGDHYVLETSKGEFKSNRKPLLATGAEHLRLLPEFNSAAKVVYTMGFVMGPLAPEDRTKLSSGPMAFCDKDIDGDVLWGTIDEKGYLTIGYGDIDSKAGIPDLRQDLANTIEELWPGLTKKYPPQVCHGPVHISDNGFAIAGRGEDRDYVGAHGSSGILDAYAFANAYGRWIAKGKDDRLRMFEEMRPTPRLEAIKTVTKPVNGPFFHDAEQPRLLH